MLLRQILSGKLPSPNKVTFPTCQAAPPCASATKVPFVKTCSFLPVSYWLWTLRPSPQRNVPQLPLSLVTEDPPLADWPVPEEGKWGQQPSSSLLLKPQPFLGFHVGNMKCDFPCTGSLSQPTFGLISLLNAVFALGKSKHILFLLPSKGGRASVAAAWEQGLPNPEGSDQSFSLSCFPSGLLDCVRAPHSGLSSGL